MKVLFLLIDLPDLDTNTSMYSGLMEEFDKNGHEVYAVAPSLGGNRKTEVREEAGISILRVKTLPLFGTGIIRKGIANVLLPFQYRRAVDRHFQGIKFDLIIIPTPPITLVGVVSWLQKQYSAKVYLVLRDIFPQNAVDLGFLKKWMPMYWKFRQQEKKLYRISDVIGCMSQENIDYVCRHNAWIDFRKLDILENFQRLERDCLPDAKVKKKYGLEDKFVVLFGGNMGKPQQLENVIALARSCENDYPDVRFLFIGKGTEYVRIQRIVSKDNVKNVVFKNYIPQHEYQQLAAQCDIGLISLHEKFTIPNIPSKTLSYFNLRLPILASIDAATDYGKILDNAQAGLWSLAGDLKTFRRNFDRLYQDASLRKKMGENGRKYFEEHLTVEIAYQQIFSQLARLDIKG
jgi:glycosyltransferase involved in cell wall biosynthesis